MPFPPLRFSGFRIVKAKGFKRLALLFCLFLAAAIPLLAADLRCAFCGKTIQPGSNYLRAGSNAFCSNDCYKAWILKTVPRCVVCGKPVVDGYTLGGKAYCSMACVEANLPKCVVCGRRAAKGALIDGDPAKFVCETCAAKPKCSVCNMPSLSKMTRLEDGRLLCPACASSAVFDMDRATLIFNSDRKLLRDKLGLATSHPISLYLVDSGKLSALSAKTPGGGVEMGLFEYSALVETEIAQTVDSSGKRLKRSERETVSDENWNIYALYGLPEDRLSEVFAHELAHDWMQQNAPNVRDSKLKEGWAEYIAWRCNALLGHQSLNRRIEKNEDPVYGGGFRMIKEIADRDGFDGLRLYLRKLSSNSSQKTPSTKR